MNIFKNDKKKEETVTVSDIKFDASVTNVTSQIEQIDLQLATQKELLAEAIELFSKVLKGYPVSDKVKLWVEKSSREL